MRPTNDVRYDARTHPMTRLALALLVLLAFPAGAAELHVSAAASLSDVLREIAPGWERASGVRVIFNFAGSGTLARQIAEGAPADLFLSADDARMDALQQRGHVDARSRVSFLTNALVVVVPSDDRRGLPSLHALGSRRIVRLALAEPRSVPAGIYARQALEKAGLWARVAGKVVPTENVRAALAAVESGNVDAAIVYRTDTRTSWKARVALVVPPALTPQIRYPFAIVRGAENPATAQRFLAYLCGPEARRIFAAHGFGVR